MTFIIFALPPAEPICPIDNEPIKLTDRRAEWDEFPGILIHARHIAELPEATLLRKMKEAFLAKESSGI